MIEATTINRNKRAVIYARVSTKDQDCQRQLSDCRRFAAAAGYIVGMEMIETASGAKNDRKERARVIQLAKSRLIDVVLITELSRWGRSTTDLINTVETLYSYGVSLQSSNGSTSFDPTTPQGKLLLTMISALAEFERSLIQERILSGLQQARLKGKQLGRPVGSGTTIKQNSAAVIQLKALGYSYRKIANKLHIGLSTVQLILKDQAPVSLDDLL
jgi:putative DNA-invertase from lambdoid prophage Rac